MVKWKTWHFELSQFHQLLCIPQGLRFFLCILSQCLICHVVVRLNGLMDMQIPILVLDSKPNEFLLRWEVDGAGESVVNKFSVL